MSSLVTKVRLKQIEQLVENNKRLDDRGLLDTEKSKLNKA